ncbi:hypothetical protein [Leptospira idonii]|uniref:Uncharacterized protein n=1 Tax=Leptospira idonii TaxID=1193500 RepID=A0A4R9LZV8_9LEPT|nr:hypothetical protein [Leptospira idonii]TGN19191.1 hypothetical protein EHS15_09740 [Leptospira idonii]
MIRILGLCLFLFCPILAQSNPWNRLPHVRVLSRKEVSHIVLEARPDHFRVTLLVSERYPYNYKSLSHPFFFRMEDEKKAMELANTMDKYLDSGKSFTITLKGSEISHLLWGEP